ncbi:YfbM family protein [Streptomyces albipurpureus]|uniref:YfbM family protein n=1 Tax=Streptomyces albipurpureus TaxID=2897419 RepID=A0ABT0UIC2_9ACTN|nr:YfbM family protein [Streptomyces sp. CWNU-1]MCM2388185.1 YfbM family protein [Streptomyces sp. CWNU-1]
MSMIGEYARLTPTELDRAVQDPYWAWEFVEEHLAAAPGDGTPVPGGRLHSTGKMWHALEYLLRLRGVEVNVVHGEEEIPGAGHWGYGVPRTISPERVRVAASAMKAITPEGLVEEVAPAELADAGIYPCTGSDPVERLDDVAVAYQDLAAFFRTAARLRQGLVVWIA